MLSSTKELFMEKMTVGVIGFGTIGRGVAKILLNNAGLLRERCGFPVALKRIADLDTETDRGIALPEGMLTADAEEILNDGEIDTVVEAIGGESPARQFIEAALSGGKNVVTSNKEVIAKHGLKFVQLAEANGCQILYEAAVGGGIPILHAVRSSLSANRIEKVFGIVNGTTNYILTKMASSGADFAAALKEAQGLGYAEANPRNDVEGYDAAYKLAILAGLAFRCHVDCAQVYREGIGKISPDDMAAARRFSYSIKMAAIGMDRGGKLELRVHPVMIRNSHPLASVNGAFNAIYIRGDSVGDVMFYGQGAGEMPTASAVVGDIMSLAFKGERGFSPDSRYSLHSLDVMPIDECVTSFFIRYTVSDEAGVLATVSNVFARHSVSIYSIQQVGADSGEAAIAAITHPVRERDMRQALKEMAALDCVKEISSVIRVGLGEE